ncbi:hypothetical protein F511_28863 [Dorcoceras hygrometricum]|uniref:Uncharacterized protein n=1 Tax=Dorcoceras hygrometricum TaxID=472368 RepID=A0A2Z7D3B7_9LAMI|nr:hypothetical protein F511_28863 [Dorcoceras hygrometricum]
MKIEFRLLGDILVKTIYVKVGSFDAVTHERFLLMTVITCGMKINWSSLVFDILKNMVTPGSRKAKGYAIQIYVLLKNVPCLELGESRAFPSSKILIEKTFHRYVVINEKVGGEEVADAPRVKKTPLKKAASKKILATDAAAKPVDILLVHLRDLEKRISARFDEQDRVHRALCKDTHDQKNLLSLDLKSTHQKLSAQIAAASFDTADVRKEVKEINAKVTYLDGQVAEIRSEQLDFRAKTEEYYLNFSTEIRSEQLDFRAKTEEYYLNFSTQLGLIVDYLKSGDAKKGESSSSRPQPPPDNQSRPSGVDGGSGNRVESGSGGGSQRRGDRSGSSKRRFYSSGGGPFRRSFEDWLG